jgi:predicted nucleic acid-binding protein
VTLFVDTSVWSLALRRNAPPRTPEVDFLKSALAVGESIVTTGLVLQELLQGFSGPRDRKKIIERFSALPLISPDRLDHVDAAELRNRCRRSGLQIGTIDAILARICVRHALVLLTTDKDFVGVAAHTTLRLWRPAR